MPVSSGPFAKGIFAKVTWGFSIGRYGWTESFVLPFLSGGFAGVRTKAALIARDRMAMCGNGVFMDLIRISDIAVRRDADDNQVNYLARSASDTSNPSFDFIQIRTAEDSNAYNPNVCIVLRTEGDDKVYHGEHALGGMPASKFTSGERLVFRPAWDDAFQAWFKRLVGNGAGFLGLNRTDPGYEDVKVVRLDPDASTMQLTAVPGTWVIGDRIRIINAVVPNRRRGGSIVGKILQITGDNVIFQEASVPPFGATAGPATIAHKEVSAFIPLSFMEPSYASHRNRGRPLFTPRGRRARR